VLRQRALGAALLVPPLLAALVLGGPWIAALVAVVTAVAGFETFRLLRAAGYPVFALLGTVFAVLVVIDATMGDKLGLLLVAAGAMLVGVGAFTLPEPREGVTAWMATLFGALYVGLLAFLVRLGHVAPPLPTDAPLAGLGAERGWILLLVLGVWLYDTGAYFVGRAFGRRRFLEHISPSKTYAGLVGGLAAATAVIAVVLVGLGQPPGAALVLGPLIGLAAQGGDLAESMLKRAAGVKDSGTLIPGHGGVLDRVDSFLFAAPAVTLYVVAVLAPR
jgi:phosphatidate cytidylyltransferase